MIDPVNLTDYLIVNCYGGTWDWPHNNWYAAREKTPNGRYGWYMWDAEGGLGHNRNVNYNTITSDLETNGGDSARFYRALLANPEYRILFADRIQQHFFGDGGLVQTNVVALHDELKNTFQPIIETIRPGTDFNNRIEAYIAARRPIILQQFQDAGLWPTLAAPSFPTPSGAVSNGFAAAITHTNPVGNIYYTLDGSDPRAVGGAIQGQAYTNPIPIDRSRDLLARTYDGTNWSPIVQATYLSDLPPIVITEIMYHSPNESTLEYIELQNIGSAPVELGSLSISGGITFDFSLAPITSLAPGAYLVLVNDLSLFEARYDSAALDIGIYSGRLNNDGEDLTLSHQTFGVIQSFTFNDGWYDQTDGQGFSLNIRNPQAHPDLWKQQSGWRPSDAYYGTPGAPEPGALPLPGSVIVNEILTHTDASPIGDWVELYNTTTNAINLGGWYLSDSQNLLTKFKIPAGTIIQPQSFQVFDATNHFRSGLADTPFGLSELGERVVLTSYTNTTGLVTGYSLNQSFDAAAKETTFGRHLRSDGKTDFVALHSPTKGDTNAAPFIGPVVINEVMYHPLPGQAEYIKLYNVTGTAIDLGDWAFRDAIEYTFPTGEVIGAHACLFLTPTNEAAFRALYQLDLAIPVIGNITNNLNNSGDDLQLYRPGEPETNNVTPMILVDRVDYEETAPWPIAADGYGPSLYKVRAGLYGNDPGNWITGSTNGTPDRCIMYDSDGDALPDTWESRFAHNPLEPGDAQSDLDADQLSAWAEYIAGTAPDDPLDRLALSISNHLQKAHIHFPARETHSNEYGQVSRFYAIDVHTNWPHGNWEPLPGFSNIPGQDQQVEHTEPDTNARKAYRLRTWLSN